MSTPASNTKPAEEELRDIPGHPGYQASSLGLIRDPNGNIVETGTHAPGYTYVVGMPTQTTSLRMVHRLIALAWYGPLPPGHCTRHLNGNSRDNRPANLAYGTPRDNNLDTVRHTPPRTHCTEGHELTPSNTITRKTAAGGVSRMCRTCREVRQDAYYRRRYAKNREAIDARRARKRAQKLTTAPETAA